MVFTSKLTLKIEDQDIRIQFILNIQNRLVKFNILLSYILCSIWNANYCWAVKHVTALIDRTRLLLYGMFVNSPTLNSCQSTRAQSRVSPLTILLWVCTLFDSCCSFGTWLQDTIHRAWSYCILPFILASTTMAEGHCTHAQYFGE